MVAQACLPLLCPQQPTPAPPAQTPTPVPAVPAAGAGAGVAFGQDVARSGDSGERNLFGPLRIRWTKSFGGYANYPLLLGGKVVVNHGLPNERYGSQVDAYDVRTGRRVWRRTIPGTYFISHIAAGGGRIATINADGVVRGLDAGTGRNLWQTDLDAFVLTQSSTPLVADGRAFVVTERGLDALSMADGSVLWNAAIPRDATTAYADGRLFASNGCAVIALDPATATALWIAGGAPEDSCSSTATLVSGGKVYLGGNGLVLDAGTGSAVGHVPRFQQAAIADGRLVRRTRRFGGVDLATGRPSWLFHHTSRNGYGLAPAGPVIAGANAYWVGTPDTLYGADVRTGAERARVKLPFRIESSVGGIIPGLAAGQGVIAVGDGLNLTVLEPLLQPPARGLDIAVSRQFVRYGKRIDFAAAVGSSLRPGAPRPIAIQVRNRAGAKARTVLRSKTLRDGAYYGNVHLQRNTQIRAAAPGAAPSGWLALYAYPEFHFKLVRVSATQIEARVSIRGPRAMPAAGRRAVAYLGRRRTHRYTRLGSATVRRAGATRWATTVSFGVPRGVGRRDVVGLCIVGLARAGYGYPSAFERGCGRPSLPYQPR